jgi:hypothetical protein
MYPIKQSTAITVAFFAHDVNGDAVTGLTDGSFTKRISKNGAAFGAMTVTITEMENGWYSMPLSTSHSDTLGLLTVVFTNAGAKQVNLQWRVEANVLDDLATAANLATVDTVVDGIQTDLDNGADGLGAIKGDTAAILTDTNELQTDDVPGLIAALNDPTSAAIADAVWDEAAAGHVAAGSMGAQLGTDVDAILADTNELQTDDVPGLIAALNDPTSAAIADAVWDEVLTSATHDIGFSAGQRLRLLILSGDVAQAGSTANTIVLAATASATDNIYNENIISIVGGTGAGQTRQITKYTGADTTATVDRDWEVTPDNTSVYEILPFNGVFLTGSGLAVAAAATSITLDATASATDDTYNGSVIIISAGTGAGQARIITAYNGTTKVATTTPAWVTTPNTTSVYKILPVGRTIVETFTDNAITAAALATDAVQEIRTEIDSNSTQLAAIVADTNELQTDDVPGLIAALPTAAENRAEMDSNSTQLAAIVADTNELQTDDYPTSIAAVQTTVDAIETDTQDIQSRLPAALVTGRMSSDAVAISGSTDAADKLEASAETMETGAAAAGTLSTTQMTTNLTEATDDHYNGRIIVWTSGVLLRQATDITDYDGTNKLLTFTAVTEAPTATDTFVII